MSPALLGQSFTEKAEASAAKPRIDGPRYSPGGGFAAE